MPAVTLLEKLSGFKCRPCCWKPAAQRAWPASRPVLVIGATTFPPVAAHQLAGPRLQHRPWSLAKLHQSCTPMACPCGSCICPVRNLVRQLMHRRLGRHRALTATIRPTASNTRIACSMRCRCRARTVCSSATLLLSVGFQRAVKASPLQCASSLFKKSTDT